MLFYLFHSTIKAQGIYQLWGTTPFGGNDNTGVMFSTDAIGNHFTGRHQFNSYNPGANPMYSELIEYNGKFYGMTLNGGSVGLGVIFEWNPITNIYTKMIDMNAANGSKPNGSLSLYAGKFYGMTQTGGVNDLGVIFEWDPATNVYTKKIDLTSVDGCNPYGSLTLNGGKFYGMTNLGGINNKGVIFEWDPIINQYSKKIDLGTTNGENPYGRLTYFNGMFYGMTRNGGANNYGVIFEWNPVNNIFSKKIDFFSGDGKPFGHLTPYGSKLYGMTNVGGSGSGGTIFEWEPVTNTFYYKYGFTSGPYQRFVGSLTLKDGKFYGMVGGGSHGFTYLPGHIFEWDPVTNTITGSTSFNNRNGGSPNGSLTLSNGKLYGMTTAGGSGGKGVIFEWEPVANVYVKKIDLQGNDGLIPNSNLTHNYGKLYGTTINGGCDNVGMLFEWDMETNSVKQKFEFTKAQGYAPAGNITPLNDKFYGVTRKSRGSGPGEIYEWDPATNIYTYKVNAGSNPNSLTFNNGNFYGMTDYGGINGVGVIYEWNPVSNVITNKIDFSLANGSSPKGNLVYFSDKFYGMTKTGGTNDAGVIFEWEPGSNIFIKKIDLATATGSNPQGTLTYCNGKFYGLTEFGGAFNMGVIFEWDPSTNQYTKKFDFNSANGSNPQGSLTQSNGKVYGLTSTGGINNLGVMFEWDPVSNIFTKKKDFNGADGSSPALNNDLTLIPSPVANGLAGNCINFPQVTIDNSNNNIWVPITDNNGDAVAEIKANGNNLGIVSTSAFVNNAAVREDAVKRLYLDRNLTITPQFQPLTPVDIRLYIKGTEYLALKNAVNSIGQPSGILSINDVGIFKNDANCEPAITIAPTPVPTNAATWETNYVLTASINSFSSFYFLNKAQGGPLPVTLLEFKGRLQNYNGEISWQTTDEYNTRSFELERSTDGRIFKPIAEIAAINMPGNHKYNYTDKNISSLAVPVVYYRLKQIDMDSRFTYTRIIALNIDKDIIVTLYPNPVSDVANLTISLNKPQQVQARIVDNSGKVMIQNTWKLPSGSSLLTIDVSGLAKGMYYLELKSDMINERRKFVK